MSISFDHSTLPQRIIFRSGAAVESTVSASSGLGAERILLIADPFAEELARALTEQLPVVARIDEVPQHVPVSNALAAVDLVRSERIDAVISVGGGSATGLAKIVARDTGVPIVAVPTTFAGSEATNVWGLTDAGRKITGVDDAVLPRVVVYDAQLMATMPAALAMSSALNAVAHAIDGFWAPRADPINRALGTEGLRALFPGIRELHDDPESLGAREKTLYGAYLAAVAFASAGSGLHHKICHALGGTFNLPHAETHSVVIGYVAAFNAPYAPDAAQRAVDALGGQGTIGNSLERLRHQIGAPRSLADLGLRQSDIVEAASIILPTVPTSNPRPTSLADLQELLEAAWSGASID